MRTKNRSIQLCRLLPLSETAVLSEEPFTVDLTKRNAVLLLQTASECNNGYTWTEHDYLILDLELTADSTIFIALDFYQGKHQRVRLNYSILPNRRIKLAFPLNALTSDRCYLTPKPGNLKGHVYGSPTKISEIDSVQLIATTGRHAKTLRIYGIAIRDTLPDFTVQGDPMVDRFGQNRDVDFPGKVHSEAELVQYLQEEYRAALENSAYPNPDWDEYGGYTKLKFDKTGAFHTHFDGTRWWLVDPEGNAFLSNGVCYASRMGVHGFVDGMEALYEWLPQQDDSRFKDAWTTADNSPEYVKRNGKESGKHRRMFNFARANMIRAFGDDWWNAWQIINTARMKRWGFNTISVCVNNYFDENVYEYLKKAKMPYTWTLKYFPKTKQMVFRDFPDVFSPEYHTLCDKFAEQLRPFAGDKYMIGYFINNEPEWLACSGESLTEQLLYTEAPLVCKTVFRAFLQEKYGTIEALNKAWECSFASFDTVIQPTETAFPKNSVAKQDFALFAEQMIREYTKVPLEAIRKHVPDALCLGMRYADVRKDSFAGGECFDCFSFNCYQGDPSERIATAAAALDRPLMIGEWHIGAADSNFLTGALVNCPNEAIRAEACANYIEKAFSQPNLIGAHYFEYNDQPFLGRFDGEAHPIGLIDVCNRPYPCTEQIANTNQMLYEIALHTAKLPPRSPVFVPGF